jgi:DNA-binding transcriptional LysR family regulator
MRPWFLEDILYSRGMELRHLRYFYAVVDTLNFSRAAERLRVAQPALSRQIRDLENELGVQLFNRNRVRVQLTDAGRTLAGHVAKILAQVDIAIESVSDTKKGVGGQLMICNDWRFPMTLIPETIDKFRDLHPRVEIEIVDLPRDEQLAALRAGHAHVCFLERNALPTQAIYESMPVVKSEIRIVVSARHPLARRSSARLVEFSDATFIKPTGAIGPLYTSFVLQRCRLARFAPIFVPHKCTSLGGLLAAVDANLGVAIIPDYIWQPKNSYSRAIASDCPPLEFHAVWMRAETSHFLHDYLEILRGSVAEVKISA